MSRSSSPSGPSSLIVPSDSSVSSFMTNCKLLWSIPLFPSFIHSLVMRQSHDCIEQTAWLDTKFKWLDSSNLTYYHFMSMNYRLVLCVYLCVCVYVFLLRKNFGLCAYCSQSSQVERMFVVSVCVASGFQHVQLEFIIM